MNKGFSDTLYPVFVIFAVAAVIGIVVSITGGIVSPLGGELGNLLPAAKPGSVCGNTVCEEGETASNCPEDCKNELEGVEILWNQTPETFLNDTEIVNKLINVSVNATRPEDMSIIGSKPVLIIQYRFERGENWKNLTKRRCFSAYSRQCLVGQSLNLKDVPEFFCKEDSVPQFSIPNRLLEHAAFRGKLTTVEPKYTREHTIKTPIYCEFEGCDEDGVCETNDGETAANCPDCPLTCEYVGASCYTSAGPGQAELEELTPSCSPVSDYLPGTPYCYGTCTGIGGECKTSSEEDEVEISDLNPTCSESACYGTCESIGGYCDEDSDLPFHEEFSLMNPSCQDEDPVEEKCYINPGND